MKKELIISKKSIEMDAILEYYLVEDMYKDENTIAPVYGVHISLVRNGRAESCETVNDISCCAATVEKFIFLLSENDVAPATLFDIVSDKMAEGFFEPQPERIWQIA